MTGWITITVSGVRGSAPRDAGTGMRVSATGIDGTIGGGALEWEAMRIARDMLATGRSQYRRSFPLGPDLGQCCGGSVTLDFHDAAEMPTNKAVPLWIWGAGHVGRAFAQTMGPLPGFQITLIDDAANRLPDPLPPAVLPLVAADMPRAVAHAPKTAHHLIVTYSHDIDLTLCDALLRHGFASTGLIGSATKWARFRTRLAALGHSADDISRITCPIGDPSLGKHPHAIAIGVAAQLLKHDATLHAPAQMRGDITA